MSKLLAGFSRLDVTPPLGVYLSGYYTQRVADGILDPLYASALAVSDGKNTAVVLSVDVIGVPQSLMDSCRAQIAGKNGLRPEAVFIACTHTHLGPVFKDDLFPSDPVYIDLFQRRLSDAAALALADMRPASVSVGRGAVGGISFVRRFRMKNGGIQTNPGLRNPNVAEPAGTPDETVQLVRITREGAPEIALVNFQVHPDVIGGCKFSADYPKFVRDTLEGALDNVRCLYFNGAQGDTNHIDVNLAPGHGNGGYEHAKHMGRSIAGAALQIYGKTRPVDGVPVSFGQLDADIPSSRVGADRVREAEKLIALHEAGRDADIPFGGMELTTVVAEAYRMKRLEHGPDSFPLHLTAVRLGGVAFAGIPGEPFTDIGRGIRGASPFDMTFVCCCANGYEGYYPMKSAYDEGGYEARSSRFQPGVAERLTETSVRLLKQLAGD